MISDSMAGSNKEKPYKLYIASTHNYVSNAEEAVMKPSNTVLHVNKIITLLGELTKVSTHPQPSAT